MAVDRDGYTQEIDEKGALRVTELAVTGVVGGYLRDNSPLVPLEHSIK